MGAVNNIHTHLNLNSNEIRDVRLEHLESDPAAASGRLYYNSETREVRYSDGEKWSSLVGIWSIDEDGNIVASGDVIIDGNLIVKGDTASGGTGDPSTNVGINEKELQDYLDEHKYVTEDDIAGLIPEVDLSDYYTKKEIDNKNYATQSFVTTEIGKLPEWAKKSRLDIADIPDLSNVYLPIEGTAKKATQLDKSVTLWGKSFNGTQNISGALSGVSSLTGSTISGNKILFSANSYDAYTLSLGPDYLGPSEPSDEFYFGSEDSRWLVLFAKYGNFSEDVEVSGSIGAQDATLLNGLTISSGGASIKGDVTIDGNLIVKGDTSSGGTGQDTPSGGVTEEDVEQYLTNYVNDITTAGSGNVISSVSKSDKRITFTKGVTALTSHQSIYALTIKNSEGTTQTTYTPNSAEKSLTLTKAMVGLSNVENKSSATIREEITASNVTTALGYTPYNSANFIKANIKSTLGISDWALAASKPSYTKTEVGLGNVENTKDSDKNVNSANQWNYTFVTGNLDNALNVHGYFNGHVAENNISNYPFDCKAGHIASFGGVRTLQLVGGYTTSLGLYYRKNEDIGWSSWKEIMTIDENGNYCVTKTKNLSGIEKLTIQQLTISSGGASIKGNVTIDGNLIVKGDTSSSGTGQDTPGGVTEEDVEQYLTNYVNEITTAGSGNVISSVSKSGKRITFTKGVTALTSHQSIYALTIKNSGGTILTTYTPNSAEKSLTLTKAMVGLSNVENKSSATIREEITASNVITALGYTPYNSANFIKANIKSTLGISDWALAASKPSYTKTEVGLGNVENTALSSWAGTNNITTLGTITSGTWKGSKIANAYLANNAITIAGSSVSLGGSIAASTITAAQIGSGNSFYHSGNANLTSVAWKCSSLTMNGALTGATTGTFSSNLTANTLVLSNTEGKAHLTFSRGGINYIHANQGGGGVAFVVNGNGIILANAQLIISSDNYVYCGTEGLVQLGLSGKRWKSVYSIDGDFSGDLTAGTFRTSSAVACGGRLRITADNSTNNFGFLKSTWESSSNYGLMHIGTNEGGTSTITNANYDKVAMSISRSVVGIGRQYTYDELKGYNNSNIRLYVDGNLVVTGDAASGSDIRFKDIIEHKMLKIEDIANAPCFSFKWNNKEDDSIHLGTSAQYWESIAPELVSGKDFKTLNYASLGVAMGIALAKKTINHEERIKMLEDEIKVLIKN